MEDIEIVEHIAILRTYDNGSTLELNKTQQGSYPIKWDLRRWHNDLHGGKAPGRGVVFNDYEMKALKGVLAELPGGEV